MSFTKLLNLWLSRSVILLARSLIDLGKTGHQNVAYGVVATLVNITNSYDKQEIGEH